MRKDLCKSTCIGPHEISVTQIGNVASDEEGNITHNMIEMSEKNFKRLLCAFFAMMPNKSKNEYEYTKHIIGELKDKLVELQYKTTAELSLDLFTHTLEEELERLQFESDLRTFHTSLPKVIGKINLNNEV